jgi:hypothetical protein
VADVWRKSLPHQLFGKIRRRRDQHEACERGAGRRASSKLARQQQRHPSAHGRAYHHLRPETKLLEHRDALFQPASDGTAGEIAAGFAVAGIVEADAATTMLGRPRIQRHRLGAPHV